MLVFFFIFVLGLVIGSFLNVVILRFDEDFSLKTLMGRSHCPNCKKILNWYELIPILSFFIQKRKCRGCKNKISWQYPIVELLTAVMFLVSAYSLKFITHSFPNFEIFGYLNLLYLWAIFSILIVITIYDIKHKIIPDILVFSFAGLSFVFLLVSNWGNLSWLEIFSGPILATPFAILWLVSQGRWIGLGDAKLVLGIGWFLGLIDGISAIILAFWIGSFFGIFLIILSKLQSLSFIKKNFTIKSEVPFAPFLILSMILIFLFGWDILNLKLVVGSLS